MMRNNRYWCKVLKTRHTFDPVSHQCVCGKYAHGHTPPKKYAKPRAECQICERQQACDKDGTLCHHGYKRPGWGFIAGDCMGEGHAPYPATDALEKYLTRTKNYIKTCKSSLKDLPHRETIAYTFKTFRPENKTVTLTYKRGDDQYTHSKEYRSHCLPSFDDLIERERVRLQSEIKNATSEQKRVEARIEKAKTI